MRKCSGFIAALALCAAVLTVGAVAVYAADPEIAWREALRTVISTNSLVVAADTNVTTTVTLKTPAYKGQLLFGGFGTGTNGVWVAKGLTTNDWVRIAP